MTSNSTYRNTEPTNGCPRPPSPRRHADPSHSNPYYHRNPKSIHPAPCPWCTTNRKPNGRPSSNSVNRNSRFRANPAYTNRGPSNSNSPCTPYNPRSCRRHDSSLRICPPTKPLLTRKRLMAHQAHAYHIVDPSPWPLTGAVAALLITSGLAI